MKKDVLTITAPNEFARDWLESHYSELISETLYDLTGAKLAIRFIIPQSQAEEDIDRLQLSRIQHKMIQLIYHRAC